MSGYGSTTDHVPCVHSYADALLYWENSKPWKDSKGEHDERPMGHRRKRHMTVRKNRAGDIVFRLYATDVVTYHADGSLSLDPYSSSLTNRVVNDLTPPGIHPFYTFGRGCALHVGERAYLIGEGAHLVRVDGTWEMSPDVRTQPFRKVVVDRKVARELLKETNYSDFRAWLMAVRALARTEPEGKVTEWGRRRRFHGLDGITRATQVRMLAQLADKEAWLDLARLNATQGQILEALRNQIYDGEVDKVVEVPFCQNSKEFYSYSRARRW